MIYKYKTEYLKKITLNQIEVELHNLKEAKRELEQKKYQLEKEWAINEKLQSQLKQERVYNSLDSRYSTFGKTNNY